MKNKAVNSLKYTGIVTLSQYIGSKKIKIAQIQNTGGNPLFDFLSDCLVGDFTRAETLRPTKIKLLKRAKPLNSTEYTYTSESGFIYLFTSPEKIYSSTKSVVRYSFMVSREQIDELSNFEGLGIGLYPDGASEDALENYAAFCKVDLNRNDLVNAALVVDWELNISNNIGNKTSG
jgi:hypothetical protein